MASGEVGRLLVPGAKVTVDWREPLMWPHVSDRDFLEGAYRMGENLPSSDRIESWIW